jgi:hypothetical protein
LCISFLFTSFHCSGYGLLFNREYVVDLVGEPGIVHGPDSSINGAYVSFIPSPFQISHFKELQSPYMDDEASSQPPICFDQSSFDPETHPYSGTYIYIMNIDLPIFTCISVSSAKKESVMP